MPQRIQLSRAKGWRKPAGAIVCSRPSRFGNRWRPAEVTSRTLGRSGWFATGAGVPEAGPIRWGPGGRRRALDDCVALHAQHVRPGGAFELSAADLAYLRGHDLCCWCPPGEACHVDVLLLLANEGA